MKNIIIITLLSLFHFLLIAQNQFTNNGNFKIHPGANVTFYGDFSNSGSLTDAGQMVYFSGTSTQNISGSSATTFNNLTVVNSGAQISLSGNTNTTVSNSLTLTSGIITTGSNIFILSNATAANLIYTNGFINGNFRRYISTSTSTYLFPVGNGTASTSRHKASFVNNSLIGPSYLDVSVTSFVQASPNNDASLNTTQSGTAISSTAGTAAGQTVIWTITPDAARTGGDYGVQLYVENTTLSAADDNMFCPLKRDAASVTYADFLSYDGTTTIPSAGTAGRIFNSGNGYAQRSGYTAFSQHIIGKGVGPLPIELLSFDAKPNGNYVNLTWTTASEYSNDYFTVQRSKNGIDFDEIARVKGAGSSNSILYYSAIDHKPYDGTSYYRLMQTDFDGKFTYSDLVKVYIELPKMASIDPNPFSNFINITLNDEMQINNVELRIFNELGEEVINTTLINQLTTLETVDLPSGIYYYEVIGNNSVLQSGKLVSQR